MNPCHICGRPAAFASRICSDEEGCVDIGRTLLGMNAKWHRAKEKYPWLAKK
jgi:hypothetical protein